MTIQSVSLNIKLFYKKQLSHHSYQWVHVLDENVMNELYFKVLVEKKQPFKCKYEGFYFWP